jgi:hypothetical protein
MLKHPYIISLYGQADDIFLGWGADFWTLSEFVQ